MTVWISSSIEKFPWFSCSFFDVTNPLESPITCKFSECSNVNCFVLEPSNVVLCENGEISARRYQK